MPYNKGVKQPVLSIVIVSFNTSKLTVQTVSSIFGSISGGKLRKSELQVIVVDNNSTDGSAVHLKQQFYGSILLIENQENLGFAKANNQGVNQAEGNYILLLNSDTVVHPGALDSLVSCLESDANIGIVAANLHNPDGSYQFQGGAIPTLYNIAAWWLWPLPGIISGVAPYQDPRPIQGKGFITRGWVGGTALCMKRHTFLTLGGFDERIFMYAEDVDLCMRVASLHQKIGICSAAVITHLGSASSTSAHAKLGELKGLVYIFKKHKPFWQLPLLRAILLFGAILRLFYFGILKGSAPSRGLYVKAMAVALS